METEWDLLVDAEDISTGDKILVEEADSSEEVVMLFVKYKPKEKVVFLKNPSAKEILRFDAETLECIEEDKNYIILGKKD